MSHKLENRDIYMCLSKDLQCILYQKIINAFEMITKYCNDARFLCVSQIKTEKGNCISYVHIEKNYIISKLYGEKYRISYM